MGDLSGMPSERETLGFADRFGSPRICSRDGITREVAETVDIAKHITAKQHPGFPVAETRYLSKAGDE
jgi:hypothetical protein